MAKRDADVDDLDLDDMDDVDEEEEERAPKSKKGTAAKKATGVGATAIAEKLGADPKTFRAWLRRKVEAEEVDLGEREARQRYSFPSFKDPAVVLIMKLWNEDDHTRGGRKNTGDSDEEPAPKKKARKPKK